LMELAAIYEEHRQLPLAVELLKQQREPLAADDARRLELTVRLADDLASGGDDEGAAGEYRAAAASPLKSHSLRLNALAKLGELYEKAERWTDAQAVYVDIAKNASDKTWAAAATARAEAAGAKLAQKGEKVSSARPAPAKAAPAPKEERR
jgi:hypothetical protein